MKRGLVLFLALLFLLSVPQAQRMKRQRKLLNREKNTIGPFSRSAQRQRLPLLLLLGGILLAAARITWLICRKVRH